jgi:uncharacterized protein YodC (DUF2158 family)
MSFNLGEVVQLVSGGPQVTVISISTGPDRAPLFVCSWIDKDGRPQTGAYPAEALKRPVEKRRSSNMPPVNLKPPHGRGGSGTDWMR